MDQINNERRSRQALAKQAREEAISTPRGVENKPSPVKVIGKRPPVSSVAPTTTETVIEETLEQKPATEVTKVEKEEVVKEPEKPVTKEKTKVKKEKTGGKVKMTTEAKKDALKKVLHDINEKTKLEHIDPNEKPKSTVISKEQKIEILKTILELENVTVSKTKLEKVISDYENSLCFLAKNGAIFNFGDATRKTFKGYDVEGAIAVNVCKINNPRKDAAPLPENETHMIRQRQNGFKLEFGFGKKIEGIKGRLTDNGNTFVDTTGKTYSVDHDKSDNK